VKAPGAAKYALTDGRTTFLSTQWPLKKCLIGNSVEIWVDKMYVYWAIINYYRENIYGSAALTGWMHRNILVEKHSSYTVEYAGVVDPRSCKLEALIPEPYTVTLHPQPYTLDTKP